MSVANFRGLHFFFFLLNVVVRYLNQQEPPLMQRALVGLAVVGLLAGFEHPEQAVSSTRVVGELATTRNYASSAPYDGGYLVAWEDRRLAPVLVTAYASRVTALGVPLDPAGLRVSTAPFDQSDPVPACIDVQCIVAWQQSSRGAWSRSYNAATNVWGPETTLSALSLSYNTPRAVVAGDRFLVAWGGWFGTDIMGRFVGRDGTPEAATFTLVNTGSPATWAVASNGSTFLVVWSEEASPMQVRARVFSSAGVPIAASTLLANSSGSSQACGPVSAAVGSTYFVGWCDSSGNLTARQVSDTGVATAAVSPLGLGRRITWPTVVAQGADFVVGFVDPASPGSLYAARLSGANLGVIAPGVTALRSQPGPLLLRFSPTNNGQVLATWSISDADSSHLYSSLVDLRDGGLTMLDAGQAIQQRPDVHLRPRVSRLGSGFVTVWNSKVDDGGVPMARALDPIGQPIGAAVVLDPAALNVFGVEVSYDGASTWATWATEAAVKVALLGPSAQPRGVVVAGSATGVFVPRLAHVGPSTLVAWSYVQDGGYGVSGRFFEPDGGPRGFSVLALASSSSGRNDQYALGASTTQFGFAWVDPSNNELNFSRLTADGGLSGQPLGPLASPVRSISLASNGTDFLLAWSSTAPGVVRAMRISATGGLLDPTPLPVSAPQLMLNANNLSPPEVAFDGTNYQVTWAEVVADGGALDVHQRSIASDGTLGLAQVVAGGPRYQHTPVIVFGSPGRSLVAWVDSDDGADEVMRVRARAFATLPSGEVCVAAAECLAGVCQGGLCCDPADGGCATADAGSSDAGDDGGSASDAGADSGDARALKPKALTVGCGCGFSSEPFALLTLLGLLGLWLSRRTRYLKRQSGYSNKLGYHGGEAAMASAAVCPETRGTTAHQ